MQIGQIIFIIILLLFGIYAIRRRSVLEDRVVSLMLFVVGTVFVIFPSLSTRVANLIGIGRGADLVIYCFILFSLFRFASISTHSRATAIQLTSIVRALAMDNPQEGKSIASMPEKDAPEKSTGQQVFH